MLTYAYDFTTSTLATGASANEIRWNFALFCVAQLKLRGYTTRGSSRNGSAGTAFSATPDGVDHWVGRTQAQAGAALVWHVLENSKTGHQVCIAINPVAGAAWQTVLALNKFETGGAWRGGGSATGVRPTDTTSSPTVQQELATTSAIAPFPQSTSDQYFNLAVREDGQGFYAYIFRDNASADASNDHFLTGYFKLTAPHGNDLNPYFAVAARGDALGANLGQTGLGMSFVGRIQTGGAEEHITMRIAEVADRTFLNTLDPWKSAYPIYALAVISVTTNHVRYWMPDIYAHHGGGGVANWTTRGNKAFIAINNPSASFRTLVPWNGAVKGTDVPVFIFPTMGAGFGGCNFDPKAFNSGLEKV